MKYCSKCGKEIFEEAVICPNCGCAVEPTVNKQQNEAEDKVSVGLCILSVLIPLFGFIYWPVNHKKTPKRAQACGITAIISWAIAFVIIMASGF